MHAVSVLDEEFADRFFYWTGASGIRYIHSVYAAGACPPLPNASYILVERTPCGDRIPVGMGRFSPFWDLPGTGQIRNDAALEIHVHLLADCDASGRAVLADLAAGLGLDPHAGHNRRRRTNVATRAMPALANALPLFRQPGSPCT